MNLLRSIVREANKQYAVYFDYTGSGRQPRPVAGPFDTEQEAHQWMKEEGYDKNDKYFVDVDHDDIRESEEPTDKHIKEEREYFNIGIDCLEGLIKYVSKEDDDADEQRKKDYKEIAKQSKVLKKMMKDHLDYYKDQMNEDKKVWDKPMPKDEREGKLTAEQKKKAKARARREGRSYPNMIDNMWASNQ